MKTTPISTFSFGYKSPLKTHYSALVVDVNNRNRSGDFFSKYYDKNTFEKYCNQFVGVKFSDLNGLEYVDNFKKNSR